MNTLDGPLAEADLKTLSALRGLSGLRLPKVASPTDVTHVARHAAPAEGDGIPLYALLETALGVEHAFAIASAHPSVRGIGLGEADLRADLGVREDAGLDWARARIVLAARAAGLSPPRSPSTRTSATWRGWRPPAPTGAPSASSAVRPSTPVSSR